MSNENGAGVVAKLVGAGLLVLMLVIGGCSSIQIVDTGHVGVVTRFREVVGNPLPSGLHFVNPITTDIVQMDVRVLKWSEETLAYTRDVQQAKVGFTMNYRLDQTAAATVYRDVGQQWSDKLVAQVVYESIKQAFGQYNAVDLISQRDAASRAIEARIRKDLAERSILLTGFQMTNIDYMPDFEKSVEAKVIAEQEAIREKNRTVQIEEQAKQKIATAKGEAEATLLKAQAEAESIRIRAKALESNPRLVELVQAERWNGVLPATVLGNAVPFFNVKP